MLCSVIDMSIFVRSKTLHHVDAFHYLLAPRPALRLQITIVSELIMSRNEVRTYCDIIDNFLSRRLIK